MVEIVMQLPDTLARRIELMSPWLSAALELSLAGFKTPAAQTVAEIIAFLATGPSPKEVMSYHVSARAEERLRCLLALNAGGAISAEEQAEFDKFDYVMCSCSRLGGPPAESRHYKR